MIVIGLDTATKTGYAIGKDGEIIDSGVADFTPKRGDGPGMRFLRFRLFLEALIETNLHEDKDILVVYERAHHRGGAATEVGVGLTTRVMEICETLDQIEDVNVNYTAVHSGTLKVFATGHGKAKKPDMAKALQSKIDSEGFIDKLPESDDEIDAIWLCCMGMAGKI